MLTAFRLMLVFTLLDPIRETVAHLFIAVGVPEKVGVARFTQLIVLVAGLFLLGPAFGIAGVALAVDVMLLIGIAYLLWQAKEYVDFSLRRLFLAPTIALLPALLAGYAAGLHPIVAGSDWRGGTIKGIVYLLLFGGILLILESRELVEISRPYLMTPIKTWWSSRYTNHEGSSD